MLSYFSVNNYKNFPDTLTMRFDDIGKYHFNSECITQGHVTKMLVYGCNGTGKTNLGYALKNIQGIFNGQKEAGARLPNADSSSDLITFSYGFRFEDTLVEYEYVLDGDQNIVSEDFSLNGDCICRVRQGKILQMDKERLGIPTLNLEMYEAGSVDAADRIPLIRWIAVNSSLPSASPILQVKKFAEGIKYIKISDRVLPYDSLNEKSAQRIGKLDAQKLQEFLSLMGFDCELEAHEEPDGKMQLYFEYATPIKFYQTASSGVRSLTELFWCLKDITENTSLLYLDEFDAYLHFEMSELLFGYMKENYPDIQIVFTTHNTELFSNKLSRPDAIQILSRNHRMTPLYKATERELREGHNLEKMYRSGEFQKYE